MPNSSMTLATVGESACFNRASWSGVRGVNDIAWSLFWSVMAGRRCLRRPAITLQRATSGIRRLTTEGLPNPSLLRSRRRSGEEHAVPFMADLGKLTGGGRQRIRDKVEIADGRCPLHLRRIADE